MIVRRFLLSSTVLATVTAAALGIARPQEGRSLIAYLDPISIPTICAGITKGVKLGDVATEKQCDAKEEAAMRVALETVDRCAHVPLTINEWAAWGSFTFNTGPGAPGVKDGFCWLKNGQRPTLLKKLWALDYAGACNELPKWVKGGGIRWPGLVNRRRDERAICLTP